MSLVPEDLPIRELLIMLLGEEGKRKLENRTKTNDQAFSDYYDLIANTHTAKCLYESKRLLNKFRSFVGQFPPTTDLAIQFLGQFADLKLNTKARYAFVLSAFFKWYNGEKLPIKIRVPKILPQYVPNEDIDRLIKAIKGKKSHKKSIERDVLLIETAKMTGLRRGELSALNVGDLHLNGDDPVLIVRSGKGAKDRSVSLNPRIKSQLAAFTKGKSANESVFGLAPKTISLKIGYWARKAGVPQVHTHSLRHYVGTTLFQKGANPRAIQAALGHESLEVTMRYAALIGRDIKQTMELLDDNTKSRERSEAVITVPIHETAESGMEGVKELDRLSGNGKNHEMELPILGFDRHYHELAKIAKTLYDVHQFTCSYEDGERFIVFEHPGMTGFFTFQPLPRNQPILSSFTPTGSVSVEYPDVEYFFEHLTRDFPELGLNGWKELITATRQLPQDVLERIRKIGNTARFTPCPDCQVCKDLIA
jgi:integrase/recombinase XerD